MRFRTPPVTYFRTTVSVADLSALLPEWSGFEKLPRQKLEAALVREYQFLHPQARAVVTEGPVRVHAPAPPSSVDEAVHRLLERATELLRAGNTTQAIPVLARVLTLDPTDIPARRELARVFVATGRVEAAFAQARDALLLASRDPATLVLLGDILARKDDLERAAEAYAQAYRAGCREGPVLHAYAQLQLKLHRPAEALRLWEEAIALAPEYPDTYLGLAQLALADGKPRTARDLLERLLRQSREGEDRSAPVYAEASRLYEEARAKAAEVDQRERETLAAALQAKERQEAAERDQDGDGAPLPPARHLPRRSARPIAYFLGGALLLAVAVAWYFVR